MTVVAEANDPRQKVGNRRTKKGDGVAAWVLITPLLILFAISIVYPLIETIRLSFYDIRGVAAPKFFGITNYLRLFQDANFRHSMLATLQWTLASTFFAVAIGWMLAMLCSLAPKRTLPFRVMIFAAYGVAEAVSGFMWLGIYRPDAAGLLNVVLQTLGLSSQPHPWLGDANTAMPAVIAAYVWTQVGLPLMMCFASIQSIPTSLREAAYVDGASPMRMLRYIVMPLSMPGVRVATFITLLSSLKAFDLIYMLTAGGPVRSTETVGYFMYRESMQNFKLGYGAAATVVLLVAVLIVSVPAIIQRTGEAK
ncbi:sugar ABC transporter permease [Devosia rhodophyticola]|uniref:Sugar ABC transporter permease n=1 Tax=Devosia rhodophyticola TaxID=3026423 RepID=A0ABY7YZW2_9HYPH|nr:sugar ABC transporter permease [Devosia rhodophyticola]WDR06429.1 sugar ABC transporter permease [Devosia rhodophyticola]